MARKKAPVERIGARHHITVMNAPDQTAEYGRSQRSAIVTSVPVTTDWKAIEDHFTARQVQDRLKNRPVEGGE